MTTKKPFHCFQCNYFCSRNANLLKHFASKKHLLNSQASEPDPNCKHQCKLCNKKYLSQSGLWSHKKKCVEVVSNAIDVPYSNSDLRNEIRELTEKITELVKNQQPSTIINNTNINVFLNDKCKNACDINKFIESIDFTKEDFEKLILNYVDGNAEIIEKNYKSLPEYERPIYCFEGEDMHQKIAHIQYKNKWRIEPELSWERQLQKEQDEVDDEPEPNSMYSFVRLFDKKKMEYYDDKYKNSHLYLKQRKFNKDCLDIDNQRDLINKLLIMATVNTSATNCRPQ